MTWKRMITLTLLGALLITCKRIPTMKQELVNVVDMLDTGLLAAKTVQNEEQGKINAVFYYANNSLYIADRKNSRIMGIDEDNRLFLEIGDLTQDSTNQGQNLWDEEVNKFLSKMDKPENVEKKQKSAVSPRKKSRIKYTFKRVDKIMADIKENIYVVHYDETGMSILKFDGEGKFLYRIGEYGRDNDPFNANTEVIDLYVSKSNGIWVKYLDQGMLKIQYYLEDGKNIKLNFEENKIESAVNAFLEKKEAEYHRIIEDIFPLSESSKIAVIVNIYKKETGRFNVYKKYFFQLSRDYDVEEYWQFDDVHLQVFNVNIDDQIVCFSYLNQEKTPILKIYSSSGKVFLEKKINLQKFNYKRLSVSLTQNGEILGVFLKNQLAYFVKWK
ncbi:MAG: hypothetical protein CVV50_03265 [Spirochaetae bacterium HGW-Spirochaetae-6]|nr:MAG: hypothetical protein CVV50_03265 [Spirochaetae bacterium HGW-Spirochaetae-6]